MKLLLPIAVFFVFYGTIHATPQVGDRLTLEDGSSVWTYGIQFPSAVEKRIDQWMDVPGNRSVISSANWKGYFIELSIRNQKLHVDRLFISSMLAGHGKITVAPMKRIFGKEPPIEAKWFTGDLIEYFGKDVGYTHVMSRMRIYRFRNGILTEIKEQRTPRNKY